MATARGVAKPSKAVLSSPINFSMAIARRFQGIPDAYGYGDEAVRKLEKITGLVKGMEVAGKKFAYGFYDGITGVVTQPIRGAKENGFLGAMHGAGWNVARKIFPRNFNSIPRSSIVFRGDILCATLASYLIGVDENDST